MLTVVTTPGDGLCHGFHLLLLPDLSCVGESDEVRLR